jgi:hypothetical protein
MRHKGAPWWAFLKMPSRSTIFENAYQSGSISEQSEKELCVLGKKHKFEYSKFITHG